MQETKIEIKKIKDDIDSKVDESTINVAIFVEHCCDLNCVSQIKLLGEYNKEYTVVSFLDLHPTRILLDENRLFICVFTQIGVIDIKQDKLIKIINLDDEMGGIFAIYKFKSGYFMHHETANYFFDKNLEVVWKAYCIDIFVNPKVENDIEIHEDYIAVFDWYGCKHYYNEQGEFKTENYPQYSGD